MTMPRDVDADTAARYPRVVLATICVPWTEGHEVDEDLLCETVRDHAARGLRHLYLFGTAGEGYAVSDGQFDHVVDLYAAESAALGIEPMVGLINLSMSTTIGRIERAMARGVRRFQFALPGWGTLTDTEVRSFMDGVLGRFQTASFIHYNLMRTGRLISPSLYATIAADHPNLVGTKNGTSDILRIHGLLTEAPMLRHFLTEMGYPFGCSVGAPGLLMSLSSTNPAAGIRFFQSGVDGDLGTLLAQQAELVAIEVALEAAAGDSGAHMDGSYEKMLHRVLDDRFPLRMLPPYAAVPEAGYQAFRSWLDIALPQWAPGAG
jgi:dihydrodipicolinate synthase/N-acetylneuraminate lyase